MWVRLGLVMWLFLSYTLAEVLCKLQESSHDTRSINKTFHTVTITRLRSTLRFYSVTSFLLTIKRCARCEKRRSVNTGKLLFHTSLACLRRFTHVQLSVKQLKCRTSSCGVVNSLYHDAKPSLYEFDDPVGEKSVWCPHKSCSLKRTQSGLMEYLSRRKVYAQH